MRIVPGFLLALICLSCNTPKDAWVNNFAFLYRKSTNGFRPDIGVFHQSTDSTRIILRFPTTELQPEKDEANSPVHYHISYQILPSYDETKVLDSLTFPREQGVSSTTIEKNFSIKLEKGRYVLQLKIFDDIKKVVYNSFKQIDKSETPGSQDFMAFQNGKDLISPYVNSSAFIKIKAGNRYVRSGIKVLYYKRDFDIADPPFAIDHPNPFNYEADSSLEIKNFISDSISLNKPGFYFFMAENMPKSGFTLYRMYDEFPNINSPQRMLEPVRYLTSRKEYDELSGKAGSRKDIEKFWLELGDNPERTRELIRKFYSRVVEANRLFSSFKEGWKTDRGMIYIIYGAPNIVYRTSNSESWVYGDENSLLSTNFSFIRVNNPFTDNDYTLNRTPAYQNNWYSAIEIWRHGRAFNEN